MIDFRKLNHLFFIAEFPSCIRIESTIGILITKSKIIIFLNPEKISLKVPSTNPMTLSQVFRVTNVEF